MNPSIRETVITLFSLPNVLLKAYNDKSLNEVAEYIYKLNSLYNGFYADNRVLSLEDKDLQESYLYLSKVVYDTNIMLLDLMGIDCPEKM